MLYEEYIRTWDAAEVDEFLSLRHEEYHIVSHSKNRVTKLSYIDTDQWADWMIASKFEERRLRYENEDIIVFQNITTFSMPEERKFCSST